MNKQPTLPSKSDISIGCAPNHKYDEIVAPLQLKPSD